MQKGHCKNYLRNAAVSTGQVQPCPCQPKCSMHRLCINDLQLNVRVKTLTSRDFSLAMSRIRSPPSETSCASKDFVAQLHWSRKVVQQLNKERYRCPFEQRTSIMIMIMIVALHDRHDHNPQHISINISTSIRIRSISSMMIIINLSLLFIILIRKILIVLIRLNILMVLIILIIVIPCSRPGRIFSFSPALLSFYPATLGLFLLFGSGFVFFFLLLLVFIVV